MFSDEQPYCAQARYHASLPENAVPGTFVLTVAVQDMDLEPSTSFHLVGDGAEHFYLHKETGTIHVYSLFSYIL